MTLTRTSVFTVALCFCTLAAPFSVHALTEDLQIYYSESEPTAGNGERLTVYAEDVTSGKTYSSTLESDGKTWVTSPVMEMELAGNPETGSFRYRAVGEANKEVSERFTGALNQELQNYQERNPSERKFESAAPDDTPADSLAKKDNPPQRTSKYEEVQLPSNPADSPASGESYAHRKRAKEMPYKLGETLAKLQWDADAHLKQQQAQRNMIETAQRQVARNLAELLRAHGVREGAIKAQMLLGLQQHLKHKEAKSIAFTRSDSPKAIYLTKAGQEILLERAAQQREAGQWMSLAHTLTYLANPWSGITGDDRLGAFTDHAGVMKGPVIRENSLEITGPEDFKFRLLQLANLLQAVALQDSFALGTETLGNVVAAAGMAIKGSSILAKWGAQDKALQLLDGAETAVAYLRGVESGIKIEIIDNIEGAVDLVVGTGSLAWKFFEDPKGSLKLAQGIFHAVASNAGPLVHEAFADAVDTMTSGTPEEQGQLIGRLAFQMTTDILSGGASRAGKGAIATARMAVPSVGITTAAQKALIPVKKIAAESQQLARLGPSTYTYVENLPDLEELGRYNDKVLSFHESFDGPIAQVTLLPGAIINQAQRGGQGRPGHFFSLMRPKNRAHAEELFDIAQYKNFAEQTSIYLVTEPITVYFGKVAGGKGTQIFIPGEFLPKYSDMTKFLKKAHTYKTPEP